VPINRVFDAGRYRDNPKTIAEYLNDALSTQDPFVVTRALRTMVRAQGMTRFGRKAGMRRGDLDKALAEEAGLAFDIFFKLLIALDMQLTLKPVAGREPKTEPTG
jgi:probable addiction module antidote protein